MEDGRRDSNTQPRIPLDSIKDLKYLEAKFSASAREKLDRHLPRQSEDEEDVLRTKVEELVQEVCSPVHLRL